MSTKPAKKRAEPKKHGYTKEALIAILTKCIPLYKRAKNTVSFHEVLAKHCTYSRPNWEYWLNVKKDEEIREKFNQLRSIQENRFLQGGSTGALNPQFSMFVLRTKHGYVEQQHVDRLAFDREKFLAGNAEGTEAPLNINFTVAPHRTDEEINRLLGEASE